MYLSRFQLIQMGTKHTWVNWRGCAIEDNDCYETGKDLFRLG
jgi:hypothetical protein